MSFKPKDNAFSGKEIIRIEHERHRERIAKIQSSYKYGKAQRTQSGNQSKGARTGDKSRARSSMSPKQSQTKGFTPFVSTRAIQEQSKEYSIELMGANQRDSALWRQVTMARSGSK